jgi:hypothetical protein
MRRSFAVLACAALLAAGCASYDGRGLVPGKSTAAEVQSLMGVPAERQPQGADTILWYPRGPEGFHSYAVRIGPDGVMKGIEQRLDPVYVRRLVPGAATRQEVRELLGPPFFVSRLPRLKREVWEYQMLDIIRWKLWLQFSDDGVLREVLQMRHPAEDPPGSDKD